MGCHILGTIECSADQTGHILSPISIKCSHYSPLIGELAVIAEIPIRNSDKVNLVFILRVIPRSFILFYTNNRHYLVSLHFADRSGDPLRFLEDLLLPRVKSWTRAYMYLSLKLCSK
jgi:hypothetical protein